MLETATEEKEVIDVNNAALTTHDVTNSEDKIYLTSIFYIHKESFLIHHYIKNLMQSSNIQYSRTTFLHVLFLK